MSTKNECCERCGKHVRDRSFIGSGSSRGSMTGVHVECKKPDCPCHQISDYDALVEVAHSEGFAGADSQNNECKACRFYEKHNIEPPMTRHTCHSPSQSVTIPEETDALAVFGDHIEVIHPKPTESWEEAYDKEVWGGSFPTCNEYVKGKTFIRSTLHSQREELCGRLEGLRKNESNRNGTAIAYLGYNHALDDAIQAIKNND